MKLGKRYIAVDRDGREFLHNEKAAATDDADSDADGRNPIAGSGTVSAVDLDSLPPADASEYEQHEYQFSYHWARCQELRPDANPEDAVARELVRLRAELAAAREVCDAAIRWRDNWDGSGVAGLKDAVDAYRANKPAEPTHAACRETWFQCAHCNVSCCMDCEQPRANPTDGYKTAVRWCPAHRERGRLGLPQDEPAVTPETLTAVELGALRDYVSQVRANSASQYTPDIVANAIDKLLAANGAGR